MIASDELFPIVYRELRALAAARLEREPPGQTLQPTALVHEAYLRLADGEESPHWESKAHFFAAAAEAMRRILIDRARRKAAVKHGGEYRRIEFDDDAMVADWPSSELIAIDDALGELEQHDPTAAQLVKLRYFAGLTHQDAAEILHINRRVADRLWTVAKAWLYKELNSK